MHPTPSSIARAAQDPVAATPLTLPPLRPGTRAVVALTFDVDGEAGPVGTALDHGRPLGEQMLSRISAGSFGVGRGLGRLLALLDEFALQATFYVPGVVVELHPDAVLEIAARGHDVGLHGHAHRRVDLIGASEQVEELLRGIAAHEALLGRPRGYRAPCWELTRTTFELLAAEGFSHDSSLMGDDRAYRARLRESELIELPVHWALDDWPYLGFDGVAGQLSDPAVALGVWLDEFEEAAQERRHVTYTLHPEVIGRGSRIRMLRRLLTALRERDADFRTHAQLVEDLRAAGAQPPKGA